MGLGSGLGSGLVEQCEHSVELRQRAVDAAAGLVRVRVRVMVRDRVRVRASELSTLRPAWLGLGSGRVRGRGSCT